MRAPMFWWAPEPSVGARLLSPLAFIWGGVAAQRMARPGEAGPAPVVCVGNFVAGGAGKTPTAIACARLLAARGLRPLFLTRGYGGTASRGAPLRVDAIRHDSRLAGDEALLLARHAPTIVCADRVAGARAASATGAQVIIMDDGLQNPSLAKDCKIAVVDGETGIGNGLCLPAGPLRAPLDTQLAHIDGLIAIGPGRAGERVAGRAQAQGVAVFTANLRPDESIAAELRGARVVAFAGIGRPDKFFMTLEQIGATIVEAYSFDDHQMLNEENMRSLRAAARKNGATLVTTEKDMARMRGLLPVDDVRALPVTLAIDGENAFVGLLIEKITPRLRSAGQIRLA